MSSWPDTVSWRAHQSFASNPRRDSTDCDMLPTRTWIASTQPAAQAPKQRQQVKDSVERFVLQAPHRYGSLHDTEKKKKDFFSTRHRQHSRLTLVATGRYSIYPPIKDERLSRPEPTQANDLPRVATEVPAISWISRPSVPLGTVGVNNLPTVVLQQSASAGFEAASFKHESNALFTRPPTPIRHWCNAYPASLAR